MKRRTKITERKDGRIVYESRYTCERKACVWQDSEAMEADYFSFEDERPEVGRTYAVAILQYNGPQNDYKNNHDTLLWSKDQETLKEGWPGNMDHAVKAHHGWRGSFNGWAKYGCGVRVCEEASITGKRSKKVRIVFGKDTIEE